MDLRCHTQEKPTPHAESINRQDSPWAGKHSRFTLLFEAFAVEVLLACSNVNSAAALLGTDWSTAHAIMKRAVDRGLKKRAVEEVHHVGIDEKSFGSGHDYVSLMTDLDGYRVLEVTQGRTTEAADQLWETLPETQRENVLAVAMDMWQPSSSRQKHMFLRQKSCTTNPTFQSISTTPSTRFADGKTRNSVNPTTPV